MSVGDKVFPAYQNPNAPAISADQNIWSKNKPDYDKVASSDPEDEEVIDTDRPDTYGIVIEKIDKSKDIESETITDSKYEEYGCDIIYKNKDRRSEVGLYSQFRGLESRNFLKDDYIDEIFMYNSDIDDIIQKFNKNLRTFSSLRRTINSIKKEFSKNKISYREELIKKSFEKYFEKTFDIHKEKLKDIERIEFDLSPSAWIYYSDSSRVKGKIIITRSGVEIKGFKEMLSYIPLMMSKTCGDEIKRINEILKILSSHSGKKLEYPLTKEAFLRKPNQILAAKMNHIITVSTKQSLCLGMLDFI